MDQPARQSIARIAVGAAEGASGQAQARARELASRLGLPLAGDSAPGVDVLLRVSDEGLGLVRTRSVERPVTCDFVGGAFGYRRRTGGWRHEAVVRAVGLRREPLHVVDATAGLGRDAVILALAGARVTAIERSPIIAALLRDGLHHALASGDPALASAIADRLDLHEADAILRLNQPPDGWKLDVVYIDPMFPPRGKSSLARRQMRLCRMVAGPDEDVNDLLDAALRAAARRVVVKRPAHAPPVGQRRPSHTLPQKAVRFDVYLTA